MGKIRITDTRWFQFRDTSSVRVVSGFGWRLIACFHPTRTHINHLSCGHTSYQVVDCSDRDPAVLSAFVAGNMPPAIFADYLQENGVELPGRVYELLRSEAKEVTA